MGSQKPLEGISDVSGERFELQARIGVGGMGVVYRAYDRVRRIEVALKTMKRVDGDMLWRFKQEFRALTGIVHDNLVTLYELQSTGGGWFFTMELIEGVNFMQYVRPHAPSAVEAGTSLGHDGVSATGLSNLDVGEMSVFSAPTAPVPGAATPASTTALDTPTLTTRFGAGATSSSQSSTTPQRVVRAPLDTKRLRAALVQLVAAVEALHRSGKLHLDLKPSNILVENGGRVVVCDFGLVTESRAPQPWTGTVESPKEGELTGGDAVSIGGTPAYMAPEQAVGGALTEASDWYAVGAVLYQALTGRLPFAGDQGWIRQRKQRDTPQDPLFWEPEAPAELCELCMALLSIDPAQRPVGADILGSLGRVVAPRTRGQLAGRDLAPMFVGRTAELEALSAALVDSRDHSVAVFVHGPSGLGKSALVRRFVDALATRGAATILEGRCYQRESVPYKAIDAIVDAVSGLLLADSAGHLLAELPVNILALARLFPVLRRVPAIASYESTVPLPPDPQELRSRAFVALRQLLQRGSRDHPTVVYIDDLQWGDIDSAAFLYDLIHHAEAPRLLLVATYRSDEVSSSPLLQSLLEPPAVGEACGDLRMVPLTPLGELEVAEIVEQMGAEGEVARSRAGEIARDAGGNAFFVLELARASAAGRAGARGTGEQLDQVLRERIAELPVAAQNLLEAAAVAGRPVPVKLLSRVCDLRDEPGTLARLHAECLVRTRQTDDVEELETYHDRIRETIVAGLDAGVACRIHRELAIALESSSRADPHALVEHWLGAGDRDRAGHYAAVAARQAESALAFHRAADHYQLVLELTAPEGIQRRKLLTQLGAALAKAGRLIDSSAAFLAATDGAEPAEALQLRRRAMEGYLRAGEIEQGLKVSEAVLSALEVSLPKSKAGVLASIVLQRAMVALRGLRFTAKPVEQIAADDLQRLDMYWSLQTGLGLVTPLLGLALQNKYLRLALRVGEVSRAARAVALELAYRSQRGTVMIPQFPRLAKMSRDLAERSEDPNTLGIVAGLTGFAAFVSGQWRLCLEQARLGEQILLDQGAGESYFLSFSRLYVVNGLLTLGRYRELVEAVPPYLRQAQERSDEFFLTRLRSWRPNLAWLVLDDPEEARRQFQSMVDMPAERGVHFYLKIDTNVNIDLYQGDWRQAWCRMEENWPELKKTMLFRVESVRSFLWYMRGRCCIAAAGGGHEPERRLKEVRRIARELSRERARYAQAFANLLFAGADRLRQDVVGAVDQLQAAAVAFDDSDMAGLAAIARSYRGKLVGGDEGAALQEAADAYFRRERVANPAAFSGMYAPGFDF